MFAEPNIYVCVTNYFYLNLTIDKLDQFWLCLKFNFLTKKFFENSFIFFFLFAKKWKKKKKNFKKKKGSIVIKQFWEINLIDVN
jgi:hypothetical protein